MSGWGKLSSWSARQNKSELREVLMAQIRDRREQAAAAANQGSSFTPPPAPNSTPIEI